MAAEASFQQYAGRRICVTGGAGFIGSHLCDALIEHGAEVCAIDDLSNGRESNLEHLAGRIQVIRASVLDPEALGRAVSSAEIVFHLAAIASVPRSVNEPALYIETNTIGTLRVLEAAREAGVKRIVYAGSSSAYGDQPGLPRVETMAPDLRSPYAAAKCAGEQLVTAYAHCYELSTTSLRYFNIFGPRQRPDSPYAAVIPLFTSALLDGHTPQIYGDGSQTRDFTFVTNAVHANLLAGICEKPLSGQVVNVACGEGRSVIELLKSIADLLGVEPVCEHVAPRIGEVQHSRASIARARDLIGYDPIVSFEAGLRETVSHYQQLLSS